MRLFPGLTALCAAALFTSQAIAAPLILATKSFTEQRAVSTEERIPGTAANQYRHGDFP